MIDLLSSKLADVEGLIQSAIAVMALVMVISVWARSKALVPTLGAVMFGALVVWGVNNVEFLEQKVDEEFQSSSAALVEVVDGV